MKRSVPARVGLALCAAVVLALAGPLAASAHVEVNPDTAAAGGDAVLTFRVPTESNTASTVKVEVDLPTDAPFTSVSYQPIPGWSTEVVTQKLPKPVKIPGATVTEAPAKVVWTAADGSGIDPGQFEQFVISAETVPDTGHVLLPVVQTYSDGSVVHWDQKATDAGEEPEHPAPVLYINDTPPEGLPPATVPIIIPSPVPSPQPSTGTAASQSSPAGQADSNDSSGLGIGLGLAGLALGAIALVVSVLALTKARAPIPPGPEDR